MADDIIEGAEPPAEKPKYDQAFFLALALKGKDEWNKWRRNPANKDVQVTFAGVDFSEAPNDHINFQGFEFGNRPDFSSCKWHNRHSGLEEILKMAAGDAASVPGHTCFRGADFGLMADFTGAAFSEFADFTGTAFGLSAIFRSTSFGCSASFRDAVFGSGAEFTGVTFGDDANFDDGVFGNYAFFDAACFSGKANFEGTAFGWETSFAGAMFRGDVEFKGKTETQSRKDFETRVRDVTESVRAALKKRHEESWTGSGSGPDRFLTISFANAHFDNEAVFSVRFFEADADFTNAHFYYPPDFGAVTNASRIDFTGTRISFVAPSKLLHWTKNGRIPVRLRAFRKFAEETKNHDLERDLYIEERKAERGVYLHQRWEDLKKEGWKSWPRNSTRLGSHLFWIGIMYLYSALADYGRSFARPLVWLIASGIFFYWCYSRIFAPLVPKVDPLADQYDHAVRMLAVGNTVPFVGPLTIDSEIKKFLFCPSGAANCLPIPPEGYQLLVLSQNLLSIILVFFIGLALRNYFKIK